MTTCGVLRVRDLPLTYCPFVLPRAMAEVEPVPAKIKRKNNSRYRKLISSVPKIQFRASVHCH